MPKQHKTNSKALFPTRPLFISASGRGGSTWVLDALAEANNLSTVFEPLHPIRVPGAAQYAFRYIPDDADPEELKAFLDLAMNGDVNRLWTHCRVNLEHLWHGIGIFTSPAKLKNQYRKHKNIVRNYVHYGRKRPGPQLVKFIRANLMVGWLHRAYSAPVIVLLRHPGAVVESKNRLSSWSPTEVLEQFRRDEALWNDYLAPLDLPPFDTLDRIRGFAMQWCIETLVALRQASRFGLEVIYYEKLVISPEDEWRRAINALGLSHPPQHAFTHRPSQQASLESQNVNFDHTFLSRWRTKLSTPECHAIQDMIERFHISEYHVDSPFPQDGNDVVHDTQSNRVSV
ncbi:hypothetical protein [Desulfovibrio inopinatus]|uniref:hypothetical protein n=1 Tax=Desulfovibrio inopinatus TaxID=102109 RepID=UPI000400CBA1|nr:hypothetical protein [Desulfovibrio inopinatus]